MKQDVKIHELELKRIGKSNYFVSSCGKVFSNFNSTGKAKEPFRELTPHNRNGYPSVRGNFYGDRIRHQTIHRLVIEAFIPNPDPEIYDQVNHKNGIKTDNRAENLEWSNASHNMFHAYQNVLMVAPGNRKGFTGRHVHNSIPVKEYTVDGRLVRSYESISLTRTQGYNPTSVSRNCRGETQTYRDRIFKFDNTLVG